MAAGQEVVVKHALSAGGGTPHPKRLRGKVLGVLAILVSQLENTAVLTAGVKVWHTLSTAD